MTALHFLRDAFCGYLAVGVVLGLAHPKIFRPFYYKLREVDLGLAGLIAKPLILLLMLLILALVWPLAWLNAGKPMKTEEELLVEDLEPILDRYLLNAARSAMITYAGGDGSSFSEAIVLIGATASTGPLIAKDVVGKRFPGSRCNKQSAIEHKGRSYEVIEFTAAEGECRTMYFHISVRFLNG